MIDLKTQKDAATKAARTIADGTVEYATKAMDFGVDTAKSVAGNAGAYFDKAKDFGSSAADTATETARTFFEKAQGLTGKGIEKVSEVQVGEKNVGERAQATVDTVQEKIDVDQIQDQVAKLREQMEHVLVSWKDSFLPATRVTEEVAEASPKKKAAPAKKVPVKKATSKAAATKKATPTKTASTKAASTKAATKK